MVFLKSPLGVTISFAVVVGLLQLTNWAENALLIGLLVALSIATFFLHELGHAVFGVAAGYRFQFLIAGPLTIARDGIHINEVWAYFGGIASCMPVTDDLDKIRRQHILFAAGGPIFSFFIAAVALGIGMVFDWQYLKFFGLLNVGVLAATAIPFTGAMKSDGRVVVDLMRGGDEAASFLSSILLMKEMMTTARPTSWPKHLVEQARMAPACEETMMNSYLLFYYDLLAGGFEQASANVSAYKALPVTKKNKMSMQFATHLKQLDLVWTGTATVAQLQELQRMMLAMEPISYKRSEWLLAKMAGNEELAKKKLAEHREQIARGKKQFGFYEAEERLTELFVERLAN